MADTADAPVIGSLEEAAELYRRGTEVAIPIRDVAFAFAVPIPDLLDEGIEVVIDPHDGLALVVYSAIMAWAGRTGRRVVAVGHA